MPEEKPKKEASKEKKEEKIVLTGGKIWIILIIFGLLAFAGFNYFYNLRHGESLTIANTLYPPYLKGKVSDASSKVSNIFSGSKTQEKETKTQEEDKKDGGFPWVKTTFSGAGLVLLIIAIVFAKKRKNKEEDKPKDPLEKIIIYLKNISRRKKHASDKIEDLEQHKKKASKDLRVMLGEIKKAGGMKNFVNEILPFFKSGQGKELKKLREESDGLKKLILENIILLRVFRGLSELESYILHFSNIILAHIQAEDTKEETKKQEMSSKTKSLVETSNHIIGLLAELFKILNKEDLIEKKAKDLLNNTHIENKARNFWAKAERLNEEWVEDESSLEEELSRLIEQEFSKYSKIKPLLDKEKETVEEIIIIIEEFIKIKQNTAKEKVATQTHHVPSGAHSVQPIPPTGATPLEGQMRPRGRVLPPSGTHIEPKIQPRDENGDLLSSKDLPTINADWGDGTPDPLLTQPTTRSRGAPAYLQITDNALNAIANLPKSGKKIIIDESEVINIKHAVESSKEEFPDPKKHGWLVKKLESISRKENIKPSVLESIRKKVAK
ncbi:MAG: hypothetical protein U9O94_01680 [Nanoarchaeota archaeon]|nr:hypothetical protein [Nanoarchaeota archaeon]